MLLIIALGAALASEPKLPPGINCEVIREQVAAYGYAKSIYWARNNGYSWKQIAEARKCLK